MTPKTRLRFPTFFLLTIIFLIPIFANIGVYEVEAYQSDFDYVNVTWSDANQGEDEININNQMVQLNDGRFIYAVDDLDSDVLILWIFSADGTLESNPTINDITYTYRTHTFMICPFDDDEILIVNNWQRNTVGQRFYVRRLNVDTLALSSYYVVYSDCTDWTYFGDISYVTYNNKYYFVTQLESWDGDVAKLRVFEFDPSTNTVSAKQVANLGEDSVDEYMAGKPNLIQDPNDLSVILIQCTDYLRDEDTLRPEYWRYDAESNILEHICDHPLIERYSIERTMLCMGGGVEDYGDFRYAYFTYAFPDDFVGDTSYRVLQHRLIFNASIGELNSTALEYQSEKLITLYPSSAGYPRWIYGFSDSKENIEVWTWGYDGEISDTATVYHYDLTVLDWYATGAGAIGLDSFEEVQDEVPHYSILAGRITTSQFMVEEETESADIYFDLQPAETVYDITVVFYPNETPKYTHKDYAMYLYNYRNYMLSWSCLVEWYVDDVIIDTRAWTIATEAYHVLTTTSGIKEFRFKLYDIDTNAFLYEKSFNYSFISGVDDDEPDTPTVMPIFISGLIAFLPIFFLIVTPTVLLAQYLGAIGALGGLCLGMVASVAGGFLPSYAIFLLILIIVMAFVWYVRKGGFG